MTTPYDEAVITRQIGAAREERRGRRFSLMNVHGRLRCAYRRRRLTERFGAGYRTRLTGPTTRSG